MLSPNVCCHNEVVRLSHITRSLLRRSPETPKRSTCPSTVRGKATAVLHSGQYVMT